VSSNRISRRCAHVKVAVIGQEGELELDQDQRRRDRERRPGHALEEAADRSLALARRACEDLREERIGEPLPHRRVAGRRADGFVERLVVDRCRAAKKEDLQQDVDVEDDEQHRRQKEKPPHRQVNVEDWKLDRFFEEELAVRDVAGRNREIEAKH
jgi:hypothetical protein